MDAFPKADIPPVLTDNQWARAFIGGGRGLHAETASPSLMVILKSVLGDFTNVILIVLSTVNLQFQCQFVAISLGQFSELWQLMSMGTVWSTCS